ncbi:hypothetical protein GBA52_005986 [Prunus armeniaca]|nr:hypothetical protein GBA52_005986 [Prunus armeniaca]
MPERSGDENLGESRKSTVGTLLVFQRHGRQLHTYIVQGWYGDVGGVGAENGLCEALAWRVLIGRQDICGSLWMKLVTHGLVPIRCDRTSSVEEQLLTT